MSAIASIDTRWITDAVEYSQSGDSLLLLNLDTRENKLALRFADLPELKRFQAEVDKAVICAEQFEKVRQQAVESTNKSIDNGNVSVL